MRYLVLGGAGYIGSHFVWHAVRQGHTCLVYDNLSRGHAQSIQNKAELVKADIRETERLTTTIREFKPDAIMHFAALALVAESVADPSLYYDNNVLGTKSVLDAMCQSQTNATLVFSSTCAVYGSPSSIPVNEECQRRPESPYGHTKLSCENMIESYCRAYGLRASALRYFNAAGADPEGHIGEQHEPETHLIPNLMMNTLRGLPTTIFGQDYPTSDGTCVRDYIHVTDLAMAHMLAAKYLQQQRTGTFTAFNVGTGQGYSNKEIVQTLEKQLQQTIPLQFGPRRAGDATSLFADNHFIRKELGFTPEYSSIEQIVKTAWSWHKKSISSAH